MQIYLQMEWLGNLKNNIYIYTYLCLFPSKRNSTKFLYLHCIINLKWNMYIKLIKVLRWYIKSFIHKITIWCHNETTIPPFQHTRRKWSFVMPQYRVSLMGKVSTTRWSLSNIMTIFSSNSVREENKNIEGKMNQKKQVI